MKGSVLQENTGWRGRAGLDLKARVGYSGNLLDINFILLRKVIQFISSKSSHTVLLKKKLDPNRNGFR